MQNTQKQQDGSLRFWRDLRGTWQEWKTTKGQSVVLPSAILLLKVLPDGTLVCATADCAVRFFR